MVLFVFNVTALHGLFHFETITLSGMIEIIDCCSLLYES